MNAFRMPYAKGVHRGGAQLGDVPSLMMAGQEYTVHAVEADGGDKATGNIGYAHARAFDAVELVLRAEEFFVMDS